MFPGEKRVDYRRQFCVIVRTNEANPILKVCLTTFDIYTISFPPLRYNYRHKLKATHKKYIWSKVFYRCQFITPKHFKTFKNLLCSCQYWSVNIHIYIVTYTWPSRVFVIYTIQSSSVSIIDSKAKDDNEARFSRFALCKENSINLIAQVYYYIHPVYIMFFTHVQAIHSRR